MITPLQQTPIPLDPMRQQLTPPPPPIAPPPPRPADQPVQASEATKDKFNPKDNRDKKENSRREQALEDHERAETASKLRSAFLRLKDLKREAGAAADEGDAPRTRDLASEAATIAETIPPHVDLLDHPPAEAPHGLPKTTTTGYPDSEPMTLPEALTLARSGLGSAKEVVDIAAAVPHHPIIDRIAIGGMAKRVIGAMVEIETIASRAAARKAPPAPVRTTPHIDLEA
jgi:hypothetical protein